MRISNKAIAAKLGFSESGISMIRSGQRFPKLETMEVIEKEYGWTVEDQFAARSNYPEAFTAVLMEYYKEDVHRA